MFTHHIHRQLGCVIPGYGAAEVFIDSTEKLRQTGTDPMCKKSRKPLHVTQTFETKILRSEWFAQGEPHQRNPNAPKIWVSVSGGDRAARARCPRSSVETGQKCVKIKRSMKEQHSSHLRKVGACLHQLSNLRNENLLLDSGASMHMISKKDLSDAEMDTLNEIVQSYDSHYRQ